MILCTHIRCDKVYFIVIISSTDFSVFTTTPTAAATAAIPCHISFVFDYLLIHIMVIHQQFNPTESLTIRETTMMRSCFQLLFTENIKVSLLVLTEIDLWWINRKLCLCTRQNVVRTNIRIYEVKHSCWNWRQSACVMRDTYNLLPNLVNMALRQNKIRSRHHRQRRQS